MLALPSRLNAVSGSTALAAASLLFVDDSFLFYGLEECKTYLYLYPSDCAVIVNFRPSSLRNVQAQAGVVVGEFWDDIDSTADVAQLFSEKLGVRADISELK